MQNPPPPDQATSVVTSQQHRSHLIALSDTIASLQREKAELENKSREWKAKAEHLQGRLDSIREEEVRPMRINPSRR